MLVILDGFGLREEAVGNAHKLARTPILDHLLAHEPTISLKTSGLAVGLPEGVMGNSEVGHMNMGAGRVIKQNLVRINEAIETQAFARNEVLLDHLRRTEQRDTTYHTMGLTSDGGVHSHIDHLAAVLKMAKEVGLKRLAYHAITDGRDTSPNGGKDYLAQVEQMMSDIGLGSVATLSGRYTIMDRDKRWERIERAYRVIVNGEGAMASSAGAALADAYASGVGDEFVTPTMIDSGLTIKPGDSLLGLNFRADRMRQIMQVLSDPSFSEFSAGIRGIDITTMTVYDESFSFPVLFQPQAHYNIFPELLAEAGYRQLRVAETEKYAHVTYFFNGGREKAFDNELRELVPSPKVATYDLQPEMNAEKVTSIAVQALEDDKADAIIMNLANPDMVGHTGVLEAGISAMQTIDACLGKLVEAAEKAEATIFITADHGNIEMMIDPDSGAAHTAHTTLDVPFIMAGDRSAELLQGDGTLADIAPTILEHIGLSIPDEMDGISRLQRRV